MNPSTPPRSPSRRSSPERRAATQRERTAVAARSPSKLIEQIRIANAHKEQINRSATLTASAKQRAKNAINARIQSVRNNLARHLEKRRRDYRLASSVLRSARTSRNLLRGAGNAAALAGAETNVVRAERKASTARAEVERLQYLIRHPRTSAGSRGARQLAAASRA
jgi:hypothetical protein